MFKVGPQLLKRITNLGNKGQFYVSSFNKTNSLTDKHDRRNFTILDSITYKSPKNISNYLQLIRFNKPAGIFPLLIPSLWAISLSSPAGCLPDLKTVLLFALGAFLCRSGGCVVNDIIDADFDKNVTRTAQRPVACGNLTIFNAACAAGVLFSLALCVLLQFNPLSICLGSFSLLLVVAYPFMKRLIDWPQAFLGLVFNWGCFLGVSAVRGTCELTYCLPLYMTGILWTLIYDTIYAHQDKRDDVLIGVRSSALSLGQTTKAFSSTCLAGMTGILALTGNIHDLAVCFYPILGLSTAFQTALIWKVDLDDPYQCWRFFSLQAVYGSLILSAIILGNFYKNKTILITSN